MAYDAIIPACCSSLRKDKSRGESLDFIQHARSKYRRSLMIGGGWVIASPAALYAATAGNVIVREASGGFGWIALLGAAVLGAAVGVVVTNKRANQARNRELADVAEAHEKAILGVLEQLPLECWAMDREGNYTLINATLRAYWRLPARASEGKYEKIPIPENLVARWQECNRRALDGETVRDEFVHERDGFVRNYFRIVSPFQIGKRVKGILGIHLDITDRVESERAWHATENRLTHYFRQNPCAVIEWNTQALVTMWNPAAELIFEYTTTEAKGKTAIELIVPSAERYQFSELWKTIIQEGKEVHLTGRNRRKSGGTITCEWQHSPLKDKNDRVVAIVSFAFDVTERVVLEERLRQAAQLESMGRLAAGVAHEFNNLLAPMLIEVDRLARGGLGAAQARKHVDRLRISIAQAQALTDRTLTVAGKTIEEPEWLNLGEIVRTTIGALSVSFDRRVEVVYNTDTPLPSLRIERSALAQIVTHLALNAYDTVLVKLSDTPTSEWKPRLIISTGVVERDRIVDGSTARKRYQMLAVTDNGEGIEREHQSKVFEPFFTTKPTGTGRGLGLATVWRLAETQGGWVELESAFGRGSTFWAFFPEVPSDVALLPSASVWLASEDEETRRFRILLVEDNMLVAEAIASLLNDAGHQVTTAADGEEGWALLRPHGESFDLVISDLNLPGMSGGELLETIVEHQITLPVLLITGYCEPEEVAGLLKLGAKALLKKPVQPRELLDFIAYYAQEGPAKTGANPSLS